MKQIFFNYFLCGGYKSFKENRIAYEDVKGTGPEKAPKLGEKSPSKETPTTGILHDMLETVGKVEGKKDRKTKEVKQLTGEERQSAITEILRRADALEKDGSPENIKQLDVLARLEKDKPILEAHIAELEAKLPSVTDGLERTTLVDRIKIKKADLAALEIALIANDPIEMARKLREESNKFKSNVEKKQEEQMKEIDARLASYDTRNIERDRADAEKGKTVTPVNKLDIYQKVLDNKVSADSLKIDSHASILTTMKVFKGKLGLPQNVVDWMGHELDFVNTDKFNFPVGSKEYEAFKNPELDAGKLAILEAKNPGFKLAFEYYETVKRNVAIINASQLAQKENASKSGEEPVFTFTTEKIQGIGRDLANAWHDRDASKLAMYAVAGYGIYKFYTNFLKGSSVDKDGNPTLFGHIKKWGPILAGAYAAGWLIFPEKMKDVVGLGKNIDYNGTNVEGLAQAHRDAPKGSNLDKMDPAVLFTLHNANIEDVFGPITPQHSSYNDTFANNNMISLATTGVAGYYAPDLRAQGSMGPAVLEQGKNMTAKQKQYVEASKKLYETANALREFYKEKIQPTTGVSFEDMFLNPKSRNYRPGYTMGSLYEMFRDYLPSQKRIYESSDFKQAEKDLKSNSPKTDAFNTAQLTIDSNRPAGENVAATIYGYPVTLNRQDGVDGKSKYTFFLAGREGVVEEKVEYTTDEDSELAANKLKANIEKRLKDYLNGVSYVDKTAGSLLKYEGGKWFFEVKTEKQHLIDSTDGIIQLVFDDTGKIKTRFEGKDVTVLTSADLPFKDQSLVVDMFRTKDGVSKSNFEALIAVSDQITILHNNPGSHEFDISVFGIVGHVRSDKTKNVSVRQPDGSFKINSVPQYYMDPAEQKKFIKDEKFQEKYAESRINSNQYQGDIAELNGIIDKLNSKSFVSKIGGSASSVFEAIFGNKPLGAAFDGSVPNNYIKMQIEGQKSFLKNLLKSKMNGAKDFTELQNATEQDIVNRFARVRAFIATIDSLPEKKLSAVEMEALVVAPLRSLSYNSIVYADAARIFERDFIGPLSVSDRPFNDDSVTKAAQGMNVYQYHTAEIDKPELDKQMVLTPGDTSIIDRANDRAYLSYITKEMSKKRSDFLAGKISPNPTAWGLLTRAQWEADPRTTKPALSENVMLSRSEVEQELRLACQKIVHSYSDDDFATVAQVLFNTYSMTTPSTTATGPTTLFFSVAATRIVGEGRLSRTDQIGDINKVAEDFRKQCELAMHDEKLAQLRVQPGWKGRIKEYLYEKFAV